MRISDWSSDVCSSDLADALSRADQVFLFKRAMREAAMRHGVYATFLAKPMSNEPGSAMHIHQSLVDVKTRRNLFMGKKAGQHSELFSHYLGGLQKYIPMAMALLAPNVNRSEEHTSELQSLMRISYAVFCLKKKNKNTIKRQN